MDARTRWLQAQDALRFAQAWGTATELEAARSEEREARLALNEGR